MNHKEIRSRRVEMAKYQIKTRKIVFLICVVLSTTISYPFILPKIAENNTVLASIFQKNQDMQDTPILTDGKILADGSIEENPTNSETLSYNIEETDGLENHTSTEDNLSENSNTNSESPSDLENNSNIESSINTKENQDTHSEQNKNSSNGEVSYMTVDDSYFDDALFIGDSRTVGIYEYGKINNADFFCSNGMSSYTILKEVVNVSGVGKTTLQNLLAQKDYKKIYIMIGINELGNVFEEVMGKINNLIVTVQESEPGALIYLQGNLHVTSSRSNSDKYINNTRINALNQALSGNADNITVFYLDPNVLFDDENGNLRSDYSSDSAHIYAKYYVVWADWLKTKAIKR